MCCFSIYYPNDAISLNIVRIDDQALEASFSPRKQLRQKCQEQLEKVTFDLPWITPSFCIRAIFVTTENKIFTRILDPTHNNSGR